MPSQKASKRYRMKDWQKRSVVYQVYPRSFKDTNGDGIGDLQGIIEKLPYIQALGANVIWLNPIYVSPNDDNGYDISDYRDIMPEFGTMADFEQLLAKAHELSLKIMMDLVVNHSSDEHPWFLSSLRGEGKYKDFYIWRDPVDGHEPTNWGASFQGSAWEYREERKQYYLHTFSKKQPDLNWENPEVRQEVYSIMKFWLDKGVDGFRMDVINYISKPKVMTDGRIMSNGYGDFHPLILNGERVNEYLKEMNRNVLSHYDVLTVGETVSIKPEHALKYASLDNDELNMVFHFEHMGCDHGKYGKWSDNPVDFMKLKGILSKWQENLNGKAWNSLYWDNHDQPRAVSRFGSDRTEDERIKSAKMLATCLFMMQGTPYVYEGEELGMTNVAFPSIDMYRDIDTLNSYKAYVQRGVDKAEMLRYVHRHSRDNARTPMHWDASEYGGFSTTEPWLAMNPNYTSINVESQLSDPASVLTYYKDLIALRRTMDIIIEGDYLLTNADDTQVFSYERRYQDKTLCVFCNFSNEQSKEFPFEGELLIGNYPDQDSTYLRPFEARVYVL